MVKQASIEVKAVVGLYMVGVENWFDAGLEWRNDRRIIGEDVCSKVLYLYIRKREVLFRFCKFSPLLLLHLYIRKGEKCCLQDPSFRIVHRRLPGSLESQDRFYARNRELPRELDNSKVFG